MKTTRITLLILLVLTARAPLAAQSGPAVERDEQGRVRFKLEHGLKVAVDNTTTGRIVVEGWDRDYVEAVATSERGAEYVRVKSGVGREGQYIAFTATHAAPALPTLSGPSAEQPNPTPSPAPPPAPRQVPTEAPSLLKFFRSPDEVHLNVKLPRHAELDLIEVNRSEVEVSGVSTPITVSGRRGAVKLRDVGAVEVRTERGQVEVDGASGLVDVITAAGHVRIRNVRGDVRAVSLSGRVEVGCVRGRVNVSNTEGPIVLAGVDGDVDATTVNSDVSFHGPVREEGRYHLKSMSGAVEMGVRRNPPGFTALLSSYRGAVESDFKLGSKQSKGVGGTRLLGRHGDGRAQITLDSFDGLVKLSRLTQDSAEGCR
ncbi:MAG TPA: hypothetical protein VGX48_13105 [Pyrinomonadaceae bacterium]|jgi:hypothetical protein|nr:hypothetical protein [Pyrinomonadaceae bacterium]